MCDVSQRIQKPMNFAIIAAGDGERLVREGALQPKPLLPLCGQPMLGRLLDIFVQCGAACISIIVNERMADVQRFVRDWQESHPAVSLRVVVRSTPSSMHSLAALCEVMPDGPFICTTVDTVFKADEFARYVTEFQAGGFLFGVTPFVDDEKPLWVVADADRRITAFCDEGPAPYVSAGIYGMDRATIAPILRKCLDSGRSRMRNFQRALLDEGIAIRAHVFNKVMDIDHLSDLKKAEAWLG